MKLTKDKYTIQQAAKIIGITRGALNNRTLFNPMHKLFVRTEYDGISNTKIILKKELERILLDRATIHVESKSPAIGGKE